MNKHDIDDKLYVSGTGIESIDGEVATVVALPGYDPRWPEAYAMMFTDGILRPVHKSYLRWIKPNRPVSRGDLDIASNWQAFDRATKLDSSRFRNEPLEPA